jgi:hypothetical protein
LEGEHIIKERKTQTNGCKKRGCGGYTIVGRSVLHTSDVHWNEHMPLWVEEQEEHK